MIPKKIHYCWYGKSTHPSIMKKCIKSWGDALLDYEIIKWDEQNTPLDLPYLQNAQEQKNWSNLANYIRNYALIQEGGIYLDIDVEVIKSFNPLLKNKCFLGFQHKTDQYLLNNAILGAEKNNSFLKKVLETLEEKFDGNESSELSGPGLITGIFRKLGVEKYSDKPLEIEEVTIYPLEYFYPYSWEEKLDKKHITPQTYCIHHWGGTWYKKGEKSIIHTLFNKIKNKKNQFL